MKIATFSLFLTALVCAIVEHRKLNRILTTMIAIIKFAILDGIFFTIVSLTNSPHQPTPFSSAIFHKSDGQKQGNLNITLGLNSRLINRLRGIKSLQRRLKISSKVASESE